MEQFIATEMCGAHRMHFFTLVLSVTELLQPQVTLKVVSESDDVLVALLSFRKRIDSNSTTFLSQAISRIHPHVIMS